MIKIILNKVLTKYQLTCGYISIKLKSMFVCVERDNYVKRVIFLQTTTPLHRKLKAMNDIDTKFCFWLSQVCVVSVTLIRLIEVGVHYLPKILTKLAEINNGSARQVDGLWNNMCYDPHTWKIGYAFSVLKMWFRDKSYFTNITELNTKVFS
jgi:hypothetical protein